jgi:hypothetical protein
MGAASTLSAIAAGRRRFTACPPVVVLAERVTFSGTYNISPTISPDGRWLAYVSRVNGAFKLQVMELATGTVNAISDTAADESPSFAPNSRLIVYATQNQGREALMTTTLDGKIKATAGRAGRGYPRAQLGAVSEVIYKQEHEHEKRFTGNRCGGMPRGLRVRRQTGLCTG